MCEERLSSLALISIERDLANSLSRVHTVGSKLVVTGHKLCR